MATNRTIQIASGAGKHPAGTRSVVVMDLVPSRLTLAREAAVAYHEDANV